MQKNHSNADLRAIAKKAGVYFWQIAALWGVSESTMTRLFRQELNTADRTRFLQEVESISKTKQEQATKTND